MVIKYLKVCYLLFSAVVTFYFGLNPSFAQDAALSWPAAPAAKRIVFTKSISSSLDAGIQPGFFKRLKRFVVGEEKELFQRPVAIAVDAQKVIYICDVGVPAVHILDISNKRYFKVTVINKQELISPVGVAAAGNGKVFISDSGLKKVFCVDNSGKYRFQLEDEGKFLRPTGLAVGKDKLYVVDTLAGTVYIFGLDGKFITNFGNKGRGQGEFNFPTAVCIAKTGEIFVVDTFNFRIQVFSANHDFLYSIGKPGDSSGSFSRPKGVGLDSFRHIYVTDGLFDNVQIFNSQGDFLLNFGEAGHEEGEFWIPSGIAIDNDNYIYVADSYNQRVQIFQYVGEE